MQQILNELRLESRKKNRSQDILPQKYLEEFESRAKLGMCSEITSKYF